MRFIGARDNYEGNKEKCEHTTVRGIDAKAEESPPTIKIEPG
jgi:hypothetical protein